MRVDRLTELLNERRRQERESVVAFVAAVGNANMAEVSRAVIGLDLRGTWRPAFRSIARLQLNPGLRFRRKALAWWIKHGDSIRCEVNDDCLLIAGLRVLLPPYTGPAVTLYRGDSLYNRHHRTYGLSWSARRAVAESFARGIWRTFTGGSVLVQTSAPATAIVCRVGRASDNHQEAEYIVDRRRLEGVKAIARYPQISPDELQQATAQPSGSGPG